MAPETMSPRHSQAYLKESRQSSKHTYHFTSTQGVVGRPLLALLLFFHFLGHWVPFFASERP